MEIFLIVLGDVLEGIVSLGAVAGIVYLGFYFYDRRLNIDVQVTKTIISGPVLGVKLVEDFPGIKITAANCSRKYSTELGKLQLSLTQGEITPRDCRRKPPETPCKIEPNSELTISCNWEALIKTLREKGYSSWVTFQAVFPGPGRKKYHSNKMRLNIENGLLEDRSLRARLASMYRKIT
jgi:hypothetical protein